jgi:hypothetical protein
MNRNFRYVWRHIWPGYNFRLVAILFERRIQAIIRKKREHDSAEIRAALRSGYGR